MAEERAIVHAASRTVGGGSSAIVRRIVDAMVGGWCDIGVSESATTPSRCDHGQDSALVAWCRRLLAARPTLHRWAAV